MIGRDAAQRWNGARLWLGAAASFALPLSFAANAQPSSEGLQNEITVIARKLALIRYKLAVNKAGEIENCTITHTSGDAELDPMLCDAMRACNARFPFNRKNKKLLPPCLKQEMETRQLALAESRERKNAHD